MIRGSEVFCHIKGLEIECDENVRDGVSLFTPLSLFHGLSKLNSPFKFVLSNLDCFEFKQDFDSTEDLPKSPN